MKNILIKYLSLEAIENTISCIKYKFDEVLFITKNNIYKEENTNITNFLNNECHAKVLEPIFIDGNNADYIYKKIETLINSDNHYYLDLTGADALFMAAAISINKEYNVPIHAIDIRNNKVSDLNLCNACKYSLQDLKENDIKLTINKYINMVGGCIVFKEKHPYKLNIDSNLIELRNRNKNKWNYFSNCINKCNITSKTIIINKSNFQDNEYLSYKDILKIINDGVELDIFRVLEFNEGKDSYIKFEYANHSDIDVIKDAGSILEYLVYQEYKRVSSDCMISVSLDWDGEVKEYEYDLRNEIDVIYLNNYQMTFVSCKNREIKKQDIYELESVARNFAGNYAKMKIVSPYVPSRDIRLRANRLGVGLEVME